MTGAPPELPLPSDPAALVEFFLEAYRHGAFPMAEPALTVRRRRGTDQPLRPRRIDWYIPDPRAVIDLCKPSHEKGPHDIGGFHISRSLARRLRSARFTITSDRAFESVIRACAELDPSLDRTDSWLDERLIQAYTLLHQAGHAHSVEVWLPSSDCSAPMLVGGVYGVAIGSVFCAESMFCRPSLGGTDASKVALAHLVRHLVACGFDLMDVQIGNHHTDQFGVIEIPASSYLDRLQAGLSKRVVYTALDPSAFWGITPTKTQISS